MSDINDVVFPSVSRKKTITVEPYSSCGHFSSLNCAGSLSYQWVLSGYLSKLVQAVRVSLTNVVTLLD